MLAERMAQPPVSLGGMDAVPPALRYRLADVLARVQGGGEAPDAVAIERLQRLIVDGEAWFGADPALAEVGYWLIERRHAPELRRHGCWWLAMFPSVDTAKRLAAIALDSAAPGPVREQAIWTLGYRQLRTMHPSTRWPAEAVQIADEALIHVAHAATTAGIIASDRLPQALRHVQTDALAAVFARAPGLWGDAIECFATPPLARVLLVSIDDISPQHRVRVLRLIGATLGEEAVPLLVARAGQAAPDERLEMLFTAISVGGEAHLGRLEDALQGVRFADRMRRRAKWHLAHRGVVPTVRGLRTARVTAVLAANERAARCAQAADDLGALVPFERHDERYLYALWGWMVRSAADPARARELVAAHPESLALVAEPYLEDLARRGKVAQLATAARTAGALDVGALQLAIWGRPLAALDLAASASAQTPELVCARVLACYRAGRPELAERLLVADLPPAEITSDDVVPFPGPNEVWLAERAPAVRPATTALARGRDAVIALAKPAPHDAEPDATFLDAVNAVERRLAHDLAGATVYLAGEFKRLDKDTIAAAVARAGAHVVGAPFPGTDYYVHGDTCSAQIIAQLERHGVRRLRPRDFEAS